ncbi:hypothetical protein AO373_1943 [Moraxella catarrhalis]|uniref:hypothetical protein n=1 Tax=Moraxella catarrhalis TaxID=480 RepID=UPI0007F46D4A|nr:hypothetical protein [Moraxella catarrhalis]OAV06967.1 hypothetical protein AO379_0461 [Moraxella catarrhalis]OAV17169.1 hypothetical protein AO373_1943 [Moraxella catarrhalis]
MLDIAVFLSDLKTALQPRTELTFKQAGILDDNGKLTTTAIENSRTISLSSGVIENSKVISILTKDGSKIEDWNKYTTKSVVMPNGQSMQIHFYMNTKTGKIDYETKDSKVKGVVEP